MRISRGPLSALALAGIVLLSTAVGAELRAAGTTQVPVEADTRELAPGVPIERDLRPGEKHSFRITLASGEALHLRIDACAMFATLEVFDPDNHQLFSIVPEGVNSKRIFVLAEKAGEYRLEIRAFKGEDIPTGRFEVKVVTIEAATAEDRSRFAAQQLEAEAAQLSEQHTPESLREAVGKDQDAIRLWESLSDQDGQGETLAHLGTLYYFLGEKRKAIDSLKQAVALLLTAGNRAAEASALNDLGVVSLEIGEPRDALRYFEEALPLKRALLSERSVENRGDEALLVYHIGAAYKNLGEYQKALIHLRHSLPLWVGADGHAHTLHTIGGVYARLGETQQALDYYAQALSIWRGLENDPQSAGATKNAFSRHANGVLVSIGAVYASTGQWRQALENYEQALKRAREAKFGDIEAAHVLSSMGSAYLALGDYQKALESFNQSLPVLQKESERVNEADTLRGIGGVYGALGEPQKALEYFSQALSLERATADQTGEAATLYATARVHRDLDQLDQARAEIETALDLIEAMRTKVSSQELRASYLASKQDYYEFYIDLLMRMDSRQPKEGYAALALRANERTRARSLLEVLTEAGADIRQGVDPVLLERERATHQRLNAKAERLTRIRNGKHPEEDAEAKKEIELLLTDYQEAQAAIRVSSPRYAALTQPRPLSLKEIQQQVLDPDTLLLEYSLGSKRSYLWAVTTTLIDSYELPNRADIETAARAVHELLANGSKRELQTQMKLATAELSRMILGPVAGLLANKRLLIVADGALQYVPFAALPSPVTGGQWSVISDGPSTSPARRAGASDQKLGDKDPDLTTDRRPLIVDHEIINLPSASALAVLRQELAGRKGASKAVAVLADPVLQSNDPRVKQAISKVEKSAIEPATAPSGERGSKEDMTRSARESGVVFERLPYTRQEADAIAALAPREKTLKAVDFDASRVGAINADLGQYRIVHFATHGLINSQHPELSGVVLSLVDRQGRPQDGFLRLHDIYNLKFGADMVVLSACRTALGKEVRGEGLIGLTRGFMYAGAARVVASLWDVKDEATAELMKRFYQGMLKDGLRPAAALRAAQVWMWKDQRWQSPYYWAAFVLQGEWR